MDQHIVLFDITSIDERQDEGDNAVLHCGTILIERANFDAPQNRQITILIRLKDCEPKEQDEATNFVTS